MPRSARTTLPAASMLIATAIRRPTRDTLDLKLNPRDQPGLADTKLKVSARQMQNYHHRLDVNVFSFSLHIMTFL